MTTTFGITNHPAIIESPEAREASLRPFRKPGRWYWLLAAVLAAVVAAGVAAWVVQLRDGLAVGGYNDQAFWAVYEANLVTFIGVSYGGAVISAILRLTGAQWRAPLTRLAEATAVVTVLIGGAFVIPHLGRVDRIWELVTRPNLSSPIFWDFVAITTYAAGSIVFFALPLIPDTAILRIGYAARLGRRVRLYRLISGGWAGTPRQRRVLHGSLGLISVMIIPLAVSVHSVLSWAFALVSRPWWHESIWAPYFVVAALYSGVALVILVVAGFRRAYGLQAFITQRHFVRLGFILAAFAAAYLYLTFADLLPGAYVGEPDVAAVFHALLLGHFAIYFWIFVVAGGLLPLLLVALPKTRTVPGMVVAAGLVVPAMWLKRMLMVADPSTFNRVTGTFGTYHFTWIPVSITLAAVAAIPLLLMLLFRVVPLLSIDEMEQAKAETSAGHERHLDQAARQATVATANGHEPDGKALQVAADTSAEASLEPAAVTGETGTSVVSGGPAAPARRWRRGLRLLRPGRAIGAIVILAAALTALGAHDTEPANAATPKPPPATITISGTETGTTLRLTSTLTGPGGQPLANASVKFYQLTTEFGPKGQLVPVGSATTGKTGTAQLAYQPAATGQQKYVASYSGGLIAGPTTARATVTITSARSVYQPAPPKPFATVGKATVGVLLTTVVLIWLTLMIQVIRVRRACRQAA